MTPRRVSAPSTFAPVVALALAAAFAIAPAAAVARPWLWPVHGRVVESFRLGANPFAAGQHRGVDIAAAPGTAVRSSCAGRVRFAGSVGAAGETVSVECGALIASYLHLGSVTVRAGRAIAAGQRLGSVGRTGESEHALAVLHLGARHTGRPRGYVDPLGLLGEPALHRPAPLGFARGPRGAPPLGAAPASAVVRAPEPAPSPRMTHVPRLLPRAGRGPIVATRGTPVGVALAPAPVSPVAWGGLALLALALPGWGLRRRARRRLRRLAARGGARA